MKTRALLSLALAGLWTTGCNSNTDQPKAPEPTPSTETAMPDEIAAKNLSLVQRAGDSWVKSTQVGSVGLAKLTPTERAAYTVVSEHCILGEGLRYDSEPGPDSITLTSSSGAIAQMTYAGDRYSGGFDRLPYGADDTLSVADDLGTVVATVDAMPEPDDPNAALGPPDGLSTMLYGVDDPRLHHLFVAVILDQDSELRCAYLRDDLPVQAGRRGMPMVDDEAVAALDAGGYTWQRVFAGAANTTSAADLFATPINVSAGWIFQLAAADLVPPSAGACNLPNVIALPSGGEASQCFGSFLQQCGTSANGCDDLADASMGFTFAVVGASLTVTTERLQLVSTTVGSINSELPIVEGIPMDTEATVTAANFTGGSYSIRFTWSGSNVTVHQINEM